MRCLLTISAAVALASPVVAQEEVGTLTATVNAEELTFVVTQGGPGPSSRFDRVDGVVDVTLVAHPDRTPVEGGPYLELRFAVTGMGPTADATDATVTLYPEGEDAPLSTKGGTSEVSLTAFGMDEQTLTATGNFASQLSAVEGEFATLAIEGDFQATIYPRDYPID